ncbi:uncharacterized protein LOC128225990 isoform X2 [Mya arenaria]|nr:uncharacterized protein LOC128225990 isoform X2 [Mya arenaria]
MFHSKCWYRILVKGANERFGFFVNVTFDVHPNPAIVKPSPVQELRYVFTDNNTTLVLSWKFPMSLTLGLIKAVEYSICLTPQEFHDDKCQIYRPDFPEDIVEQYLVNTPDDYTFIDIIPHYYYNASVRMRSVSATSDLYWSDPVWLAFMSPDSEPALAPIVTGASYQRYNFSSSAQTYSLIIYWKNPPNETWGGNITGYKVVVMAISDSLVTSHPRQLGRMVQEEVNIVYTETFEGLRSHAELNTHLNTTQAYRVHVIMTNTMGDSPVSDSVNVSSMVEGHGPVASWVSVQLGGDSTVVSWSTGQENCHDLANVTYYWCEVSEPISDYTLIKCLNLDWYTVSANGECNGSMVLNSTGDQSGVRYAVSLTTSSERNGGIVWDLYRFSSFDKEPGPPIYKLSRENETVTVEMTILLVPIINQGGQPLKYQIVYAPVKSQDDNRCPTGGESLTVPANLSSNEYRITGVQSGVQYSVCARGVNNAGNGAYGDSDVTQKIFQNVAELGSSEVPLIVGLVVPGVIIAAIVFIVLWVKMRPRCKTYYLAKTEIADIEAFIVDGEELTKKTIEDKDSGTGTGSDHSSMDEAKNGLELSSLDPTPSQDTKMSAYYKVLPGSDGFQICSDSSLESFTDSGRGQTNSLPATGCPEPRSSGTATGNDDRDMATRGGSMKNGAVCSLVENCDDSMNSSTEGLVVQEGNEKPVEGFVNKVAEFNMSFKEKEEKLHKIEILKNLPDDPSVPTCLGNDGGVTAGVHPHIAQKSFNSTQDTNFDFKLDFCVDGPNVNPPVLCQNSIKPQSLVPLDNIEHSKQPAADTDDHEQDVSQSTENSKTMPVNSGTCSENSTSLRENSETELQDSATDEKWLDDDQIEYSFNIEGNYKTIDNLPIDSLSFSDISDTCPESDSGDEMAQDFNYETKDKDSNCLNLRPKETLTPNLSQNNQPQGICARFQDIEIGIESDQNTEVRRAQDEETHMYDSATHGSTSKNSSGSGHSVNAYMQAGVNCSDTSSGENTASSRSGDRGSLGISGQPWIEEGKRLVTVEDERKATFELPKTTDISKDIFEITHT